MAQKILNNGDSGLVFREALNDNFTELYESPKGIVGFTQALGVPYYMPVLSDAGKLIGLDGGPFMDDPVLMLPLNSTVPFPQNTVITLLQRQRVITVEAEEGVELNALNDGFKTSGEHSAISLLKFTTDSWIIFGGVPA